MLDKYRGWSEQERWREYHRRTREFTEQHGWVDAKVYDAFVGRLLKELDL